TPMGKSWACSASFQIATWSEHEPDRSGCSARTPSRVLEPSSHALECTGSSASTPTIAFYGTTSTCATRATCAASCGGDSRSCGGSKRSAARGDRFICSAATQANENTRAAALRRGAPPPGPTCTRQGGGAPPPRTDLHPSSGG